ncbi:MAG: ATP-binding protein [Acidithiobacillus sp.]
MSTEWVTALKALHLYGMATAYQEWVAHPEPVTEPVSWLGRLIDAEKQDRHYRSMSYQRRIARFPLRRDLDAFDFTESPIAEAHLRNLAQGSYLEAAHNPETILTGSKNAAATPSNPGQI